MKHLNRQNRDVCVSEQSGSEGPSRREFMLSALGAGLGALTSSTLVEAKPPSKVSGVCTDFRAAFRSWCALDRKKKEGLQSQFVQVLDVTWNALPSDSDIYRDQVSVISSFVNSLERRLRHSFANVCVKLGARRRVVSGGREMFVYGIEVHCEERDVPRGKRPHSIPAGLQIVVWQHDDRFYPQAAGTRRDGQCYAYLRSQLKDCSNWTKSVESKGGKSKLAKILPDKVSNKFSVKEFPNDVVIEDDPCKDSTSPACDPRYIGWDPR